jgi:hypothetical protein
MSGEVVDYSLPESMQALDVKPSTGTYFKFSRRQKDGTFKMAWGCPLLSARCVHVGEKGQCNNRSVIGIGYCWQHLKSDLGLKIKDSTIRQAGKGLFATRDLAAGHRFPYWSQELTDGKLNARYKARETAPYGLRSKTKRRTLDAACVRGVGSLPNHDPDRANCILTDDGYAQLIRDVANGEEIFINYGKDYQFDKDTEHVTKRGKLPNCEDGDCIIKYTRKVSVKREPTEAKAAPARSMTTRRRPLSPTI